MMRNSCNFLLAFLCCLLPAIAGAEASVAHLDTLWYEHPARIWEEALPLGNGRLGAMVHGGVERETVQLNEDTFWAGGPYNNLNPAAAAALPTIRKLIAERQYSEASDLAERSITSPGAQGMPYQTAGALHIDFPGHEQYRDYSRSLDLSSAVARTRYRVGDVTYEREVFASFIDQVIVIHLSADQAGALDFSLGLSHPAGMASAARDADLVMQGLSSDHEGIKGQVKLASIARVIQRGGSVDADDKRLRIKGATEAVVLVSMATNFINFRDVSGDARGRAESILQRATQSFDGLGGAYADRRRLHVEFHKKFYDRVALDLGDSKFSKEPTDRRIKLFAARHDPALVALYFQFGRYLLIASSQPGTQPTNLQGIWNRHVTPPWDSKYTLNINAQMNYWPSEVTQLGELNEPFFALIRELAQTGQDAARTMYGAAGWVAHHNTDIWRASGAVDGPWGPWPLSSAWLVQHLWQRYLYTGNQDFLREVYPILKSACLFFEDFLARDESSGWMIASPSMSPENEPESTGVKIAAGVTLDNQLLFDLFTHTAHAATILREDAAEVARWQRIVDNLPPMQIGRYHQLQEWMEDWDNPFDQHRHVSHLYGLYPGNQISPIHTPELFTAARVSMEQRGDPSTGWSMNWKINLWARLLDGDRALKLIRDQITPAGGTDFSEAGGTYLNMFDAHPPFQIDGNFGFTAGVAEMLAQSHDGALHLLPALPQAWPEGRVRGLAMRGGFIVDMDWRAGEIVYLKVLSQLGGNLRIRTYSPLPAVANIPVRDAQGANPNPFYAVPQVKPPVKHTHKNPPRLSLDHSYLIDVETRAGTAYVWQKRSEPGAVE